MTQAFDGDDSSGCPHSSGNARIRPVRFLDTLNRTLYQNIQRMNSDKNLTLAILNYADGTISISGHSILDFRFWILD